MTQTTPTQELVAKDLHGTEWRFKHIFRGGLSSSNMFSDYSTVLSLFFIYIKVLLSWLNWCTQQPGQPRRHLLTTGWSTFVTSKRLVAGDSFVFLR